MNEWDVVLRTLPWVAVLLALAAGIVVATGSVQYWMAVGRERDTLRKADTAAALESADLSTLGYHLVDRLGSATVKNYLSDDQVRADFDEAFSAVRRFLGATDAAEIKLENADHARPPASLADAESWTRLAVARRDLESSLVSALDLDPEERRRGASHLLGLAFGSEVLPRDSEESVRSALSIANRAVHGVEVTQAEETEALGAIERAVTRLKSVVHRTPRAMKPRPNPRGKSIVVAPGKDGKWRVSGSSESLSPRSYRTKEDAVNSARDFIYGSGDGGEVVIRNKDGRLTARDTVASKDPDESDPPGR